jgi:hypothetical protein
VAHDCQYQGIVDLPDLTVGADGIARIVLHSRKDAAENSASHGSICKGTTTMRHCGIIYRWLASAPPVNA